MKHKMTIRIFLLVSVTLICQSASFGQEHKLDLGFEGGAGLTSMRGNETIEEYRQLTIGGSGGITFQYNTPKSLSFKTGVYYESKGVKSNAPMLDGRGVPLPRINHLKLSYITVPLLVKWSAGEKRIFYVNGGPYFSYLFGQKENTKSKWVPYEFTSNGRIREYISGGIDDYNRFDVGMSLGAGLNFLVGKNTHFNIELRDNFGVYNVSESGRPYGELKNNTLNLLFGLSFGL